MKSFKWFGLVSGLLLVFLLFEGFVVSARALTVGAVEPDPLTVVLAAVVGGAISFVFSVWPGLREAFNKVSYNWKPVVMAAVFVVLSLGAAASNCYGLYDLGVTCPAAPRDWVVLLLYALLAWAGSQYAHANGGSTLASNMAFKDQQKEARERVASPGTGKADSVKG